MTETGVIILAHGSRHECELSEILNGISRAVKAGLSPEIKVVWAAMPEKRVRMVYAIAETRQNSILVPNGAITRHRGREDLCSGAKRRCYRALFNNYWYQQLSVHRGDQRTQCRQAGDCSLEGYNLSKVPNRY